MARNQKKDEENFHRMLAKLNENEELLHEINDYLSLHSQEDERRREALYQSWCEQIYEPIQNAIQQGLAERSTTSIEARRLKLFNDFLAISNKKKEGLYNDVIIEGDYNPLESRAYNLRISMKHLHDPLKASAEQLEEEWKLRASFHTGSDDTNPIYQRIKYQPKDSMLPPPIWAKYKIESTPHGRYSLLKGNIQKPVGKKLVPPSESYSQEFTTSNSLDQYNMIREDQIGSVVKSQFFPGGKRVDGYESMEKAPYDILASTRPSFKQMYGTGTKGQQSPQAAAAHNSNLSSPTRASFPTHANPLPPIHSPYSQQQQQQVRFVDSPINDE